jgi:hypothetical protein
MTKFVPILQPDHYQKNMKYIALSLCIISILFACNSQNQIENTKELSREMKASQIKRVTNTQLVYTVDEWGTKISQIAQKTLAHELSAHPDQANELCKKVADIAVIKAIQKEYDVQIALLNENDLQSTALAAKEKELLEAYLYSAKNKSKADNNVQVLNDSIFVYNAPVDTEDIVAATCSVDPTTPFVIWRLLFNKKDIIRKLDVKQLNK